MPSSDPTSRYAACPTLTAADDQGTPTRYYQRRILPQIAAAKIAKQEVVKSGDRADLVAARALGNPLLFWKIADANGWLDPFEITAEPGTTVAIPAPGQ